jgi:hypothetical protein
MEEAAASPDAFMNSLLPVEESSSDSTDSSGSTNSSNEIERYYELTDCQEYDGIITLVFRLQDEDFQPPPNAQLAHVNNLYDHLYLVE